MDGGDQGSPAGASKRWGFAWGTRADIASLALVFVAAAWLRLLLLGAPMTGDESVHFAVARMLATTPPNVEDVYGHNEWYPSVIVFQRPLFYLLLHVPALVSFEAFRATCAVLSAGLPVALWAWLRVQGVGRVVGHGAALAVVAHPFFVLWGGLAFTDSMMAVAFLLGLTARAAGRQRLACGLFVAACWIKEVAVVALLLLLLWSAVLRLQARRFRIWPLHLNHRETSLVLAVSLGILPVLFAMTQGLGRPGGPGGPPLSWVVATLLLSLWLVPILAAGLYWPRSRPATLLALALVGFFLALRIGVGRAVEPYYAVLPAALVLGACAATVHAWRESPLRGSWLAATLVALVVTATVVLPDSETKRSALFPGDNASSRSLPELVDYQLHERDYDFVRVERFLKTNATGSLLLFDLAGDFMYGPFVAEGIDVKVAGSYVAWFPLPYEPLTQVIETNGTLLVIQETGSPFNALMRELYEPCRVFIEARFSVYEGWRCPGRLGELERRSPYPTAQA